MIDGAGTNLFSNQVLKQLFNAKAFEMLLKT